MLRKDIIDLSPPYFGSILLVFSARVEVIIHKGRLALLLYIITAKERIIVIQIKAPCEFILIGGHIQNQ